MRSMLLSRVVAVLAAIGLVSPVFAGVQQRGGLDRATDPIAQDLLAYEIQRIQPLIGENGGATVSVMLGKTVAVLELNRHAVRAPGFQVLAAQPDGGLVPVAVPLATTYRGVIRDVPDSRVEASIFERRMTAMIDLGEGQDSWAIQPLGDWMPGADPTLHVVYRQADDVSGFGLRCGVPDGPAIVRPVQTPAAGDDPLFLELAIDTDFEMFQNLGSSGPAVVAAVETVLNGVSAIYERDVSTTIVLTTIIVRAQPGGPYSETRDTDQMLDEVRAHWIQDRTGVRRDLVAMVSGRFFDDAAGRAFLSATCNNNLGYSVNRYVSLSIAQRVGLVAHELGHNNSANHCSEASSDCRIMCASLGGCSGDITRFGAASIGVIEPYLFASSCVTGDPLVVWVNFSYSGPEDGSFLRPFNTLAEGVANAPCGGTIRVIGSSSETGVFSRPADCPVVIESWDGSATIGG